MADICMNKTMIDVHDFDDREHVEIFSADVFGVTPGSTVDLYIGNSRAFSRKMSGDCKVRFSVPYPILLKKKGYCISGKLIIVEPSGNRLIQPFASKVLGMNEVRVKDIGKQISMAMDPEDATIRTLLLNVAKQTEIRPRTPDRALVRLWNAVSKLLRHYSSITGSTERGYQHTRDVSEILNSGFYNCVDVTLVFMTLLQACGMDPVFITLKNHAMPGLLLTVNDKTESETEFDEFAIEKYHRGHRVRILPFEATALNQSNFESAVKKGYVYLNESESYSFTIPSLDGIPLMHRTVSKMVL